MKIVNRILLTVTSALLVMLIVNGIMGRIGA